MLGFCTICTVRSVPALGTSCRVAYTSRITDFKEAANQFQKIFAADPYRIDDIDIYSNILYVTEDQSALSTVAHEFTIIDKDRPEICCLIGERHLRGVRVAELRDPDVPQEIISPFEMNMRRPSSTSDVPHSSTGRICQLGH